ncbi:MAG: acetate--CoA ligase family protein [Eubacteriales bacterium]
MDISNQALNSIDSIFSKAYSEKRHTLFEHEVYEILACTGMDIPKYDFVEKSSQVSSKMLDKYTGEIVIKIVSQNIAHKQKIGGVQRIVPHDEFFVQYVLDKMKEKVIENTSEQTVINGFLIVEAVSFSQGIGYELLYGISSDRAFGPTLTLSKGGDDAEFFSEYYDKANLFLPPFSYEKSLDLVNQLKIKHKFESIGHAEYLKKMASTASKLSNIAYQYSPISGNDRKWNIKALDVNPFVFAKDGRFMALDGYAEFEPRSISSLPVANTDNLDKFFSPKSACVLGVSTKPGNYNMASDIVELMLDMGWDDLYLLNPKGGEVTIRGKKFDLYKSPDDFECDLYVYAAPAKNIPLFLESISKKENKAVILIPGLPNDLPFEKFKETISPIISKSSIRIIGPNCMGVFSSSGERKVDTLFIEQDRLPVRSTEKSNVALLSQSGGMAISLIDKSYNCPIMHTVVSFGNKYDVKITDLVPWFMKDDKIDVIGIYVEGFDYLEGRLLYEQARNATKPIIMYKGGKTDAGAKAASSHTAAMSGDYAVVQAMCQQSNIILCNDTDTFYNYQKAFSLLAKREVKGKNVSVICNAGFESTLAADETGDLSVATLSQKTKDTLDELDKLGLMGKSTAILDVTPMTDDVLYGKIIQTMIDDDAVDHIVVGIIPHVDIIKTTKETCHDEDGLANTIVKLFNSTTKPIVVSVNAGEIYKEFVKIMESNGVPVYNNIRDAMRSLNAYVAYKMLDK